MHLAGFQISVTALQKKIRCVFSQASVRQAMVNIQSKQLTAPVGCSTCGNETTSDFLERRGLEDQTDFFLVGD